MEKKLSVFNNHLTENTMNFRKLISNEALGTTAYRRK